MEKQGNVGTTLQNKTKVESMISDNRTTGRSIRRVLEKVNISTRVAIAILAQLSVAALTKKTLRNDEWKNRWPTAIAANSWRKARLICNSWCDYVPSFSIEKYPVSQLSHVVPNAALIAVLQIFQCSYKYTYIILHYIYFFNLLLMAAADRQSCRTKFGATPRSLSLSLLRMEEKTWRAQPLASLR